MSVSRNKIFLLVRSTSEKFGGSGGSNKSADALCMLVSQITTVAQPLLEQY